MVSFLKGRDYSLKAHSPPPARTTVRCAIVHTYVYFLMQRSLRVLILMLHEAESFKWKMPLQKERGRNRSTLLCIKITQAQLVPCRAKKGLKNLPWLTYQPVWLYWNICEMLNLHFWSSSNPLLLLLPGETQMRHDGAGIAWDTIIFLASFFFFSLHHLKMIS